MQSIIFRAQLIIYFLSSVNYLFFELSYVR